MSVYILESRLAESNRFCLVILSLQTLDEELSGLHHNVNSIITKSYYWLLPLSLRHESEKRGRKKKKQTHFSVTPCCALTRGVQHLRVIPTHVLGYLVLVVDSFKS